MSNIASKIAKLIEKADSTTSDQEAETFMAKAHALMTQHGLDLIQIGRLTEEEPVGVDNAFYSVSKSYPWLRKLIGSLARYYGCRVSFNTGERCYYMHIAGRQSARITTMLMVPYVKKEVMRLAAAGYNEGLYASRMQAATRVGNAMLLRVQEMCEDTVQHEGPTANALVPVDEIQAMLNVSRSVRSRPLVTDNYATQAAKQINLNSQMNVNKVARITK